jgi:hypothetical protein
MARREDQQEPGVHLEREVVRVEDDAFLALMGGRGEPYRAPAQMLGISRRSSSSQGSAAAPSLSVPVTSIRAAGMPETAKVHRRDVVLHQRLIEPTQKAPRHAAQEPPAVVARFRHAGVDDHHGHAAFVGFADQRRPEARFRTRRRGRGANGRGSASRRRGHPAGCTGEWRLRAGVRP